LLADPGARHIDEQGPADDNEDEESPNDQFGKEAHGCSIVSGVTREMAERKRCQASTGGAEKIWESGCDLVERVEGKLSGQPATRSNYLIIWIWG